MRSGMQFPNLINLASALITGILPILKGGTGASTAAVARTNLQAAGLPDNNVFTGPINTFQVTGAGVAFQVQGEGPTTVSNTRYQSAVSGGLQILRHARNTIAAPQALVTNDIVGTLRYDGFGATAFQQAAMAIVTVITPTPSDTDMQSEFAITTSGAGSVSPTSRLRVRAGAFMQGATGNDAGGAGTFNATSFYSNGNLSIDTNSLLRARVFTFATLPTAVGANGARTQISDGLAAPVFATLAAGAGVVQAPVYSDNAAWRYG